MNTTTTTTHDNCKNYDAHSVSSNEQHDSSRLIIIATYNESGNIKQLLQQIYTKTDGYNVHVLVIDDNSPDKTYEIIEDLVANCYSGRLFLIKRSGKLGLGSAYIAGFKWALARNYQIITHMDADFSHSPEYLPEFFQQIKEYDLVIGSRYIQGGKVLNWSMWRKIISRGGSLYARLILGVPVHDLTGGFKCFRRGVLEAINLDNLLATGYVFQIETTYKTHLAKFNIKEIPIVFADRVIGQSKMSSSIFAEALLHVLRLRFATKRT